MKHQPTAFLSLLPLSVIGSIMLLLGLLPNSVVNPYIPSLLRNDKLLHFIMFFLLTLSLFPAADYIISVLIRDARDYLPLHLQDTEATDRDMRRFVLKTQAVLCVAAAAAVASEVLQSTLTTRKFDAKDIVGNIGGAALAVTAATATFVYLSPESHRMQWNLADVSRLVMRPERWRRPSSRRV
ncbi:hypothetical protein BCR33DRAFT_715503 [Rhizoclosmatium globosum]|uniref:VanZ-like domain-containing protein n=1 Tax=Rhizoclosmatium globosum TaxID=329046 RepID=A0A1Y2CH99_9FUNG|nr:hypothetical protein BCR33DRAFT_715503 [Rhizoclosmatium globosum]|eukprot:ORY46409.1 hypothetical protein BCR33DRAFT_715503 [Rhizoclosmatium globosum]